MEATRTTEMHTGGEPVRIIESGYPTIPGDTILDKRQYVRDNLDHLRKVLMFEPRGHKDMLGTLLMPGTLGSDLDVLFMHNEGYSTMCGHATIALARYAVDKGLVSTVTSPQTKVVIGYPCGPVEAYYNSASGRSEFISVPAFAAVTDQTITMEGYGDVVVDVAYGGAYYVIVDAQKFGHYLKDMDIDEAVSLASAITAAAKKQIAIPPHPRSPDLSYIFGTILTDGLDQYDPHTPTANLCVFADNAVDRSPCGSGVTARIALQIHKGQIIEGQTRVFINSHTVSEFTGCAVARVKAGAEVKADGGEVKADGGEVKAERGVGDDAVRVRVTGSSYYTGTCSFMLEDGDTLGKGFLVV